MEATTNAHAVMIMITGLASMQTPISPTKLGWSNNKLISSSARNINLQRAAQQEEHPPQRVVWGAARYTEVREQKSRLYTAALGSGGFACWTCVERI
jgi:apolipoprotein N-acyltransferase